MPLAKQQVPFEDELFEDDVYYPDTDGEPMADNDWGRDCMMDLINQFQNFFQEQPNVYVSGDILIYYDKGNSKAKVAPDVFVVFGVAKHKRRIYRTWVEGKAPDVVFEIASPRTFQTDEQLKPDLYQRLGIREYFQYDPTGECMQPVLRGRRLDETGQYQELNTKQLSDGSLSLLSQPLGLELHLKKGSLKIFDPKTGTYLLAPAEEMAARRLAEKQTKNERKLKEWAQQYSKLLLEEVEQERLDKEQAFEQAKLALQQAEQDRQQKEQAWQEKELALKQAEQERQQKELAQQQANQLAEQLRALGINPDEILQKTSISP